MIQRNYRQIKGDVKDIMTYEIERILLDPALEHLVVKKVKVYIRWCTSKY